jgi:hypothetical protein
MEIARIRARACPAEEGTVRRIIQWTLLPVAVAAVACSKGDSRSSTAMSDDMKRDLKLASQTQSMQINPDEVAPKTRQELALRPKKAPNGPKVIRTNHPTVKASTKAAEVAEIATDVPQVQVMASAPAPSETPSADAPPLARPAPMPAQTYPVAERIPSNSGSGGILGGIFGAVIRGGVVDDDHCDPRGAPARRGGRVIGGDVYRPSGTAGMIGAGGMAGGRVSRGRP